MLRHDLFIVSAKTFMKKLLILIAFAVTVLFFVACGDNPSGSGSKTTDSSASVTNPPTNSDATNPSMADTANAVKDSTKIKTDTSKMKH